MMSRYMAVLVGVAVLPLPAAAQDSTTAEDVVADARQQWSILAPQVADCAESAANDDVIVVCRQTVDPDRYTIDTPTRADSEVTGSGAPRAPDLFGLPPCETQTLCIGGLGYVPPPAIMVDFDALPETPAGSDAARLYGGPTDADQSPEPEPQTARRDIGAEVLAAIEDNIVGP